MAITSKIRNLQIAALVLLLAAGAWLRFYHLDQYPLGVHQDELSNMYDGFSIAETGADRFGDFHPAVVRGFGEDRSLTGANCVIGRLSARAAAGG